MDECKHEKREAAEVVASYTVSGVTGRATVVGERCVACGKEFVDVKAMRRVADALALVIARSGPIDAETFRFLRRASRITATELAELLGTDKSTISRWENAGQAFNVGTWATVAALAVDAIRGRNEMRERLATASGPGLRRTVDLDVPLAESA